MRTGTLVLGGLLLVAAVVALLVSRGQGETLDHGLKEAPMTSAAAALGLVGAVVLVLGIVLSPLVPCEHCGAVLKRDETKCSKCGRATQG